jgi:hypothetical protein
MITKEQMAEHVDYNPLTGGFTYVFGSAKVGRMRGRPAGVRGQHGVINIKIDGRTIGGHRLAWLSIYGEYPNFSIEHIDGDKGNNKIDNLRRLSRGYDMPALTRDKLLSEYTYRDGEILRDGEIVKGSIINGYRVIFIDGENHYLQRLVWWYHHEIHGLRRIYHINGVKRDNRIENLKATYEKVSFL